MNASLSYHHWAKSKLLFHSQWQVSPKPNEIIDDQLFFMDELIQKDFFLADDQHHLLILMNYFSCIEEEFSILFHMLKDKSFRSASWIFYTYYCGLLLEEFYCRYDHPLKKQKIDKQLELIKQSLLDQQPILFLNEYSLTDYFSFVFHISQLRQSLSFLNGLRLHLFFCQLAVFQFLSFIKSIKYLNENYLYFLEYINPKIIVQSLPLLNLLGLILTAINLSIDVIMIIKHSFFMQNQVEDIKLQESFFYELEKRAYSLINDVMWGGATVLMEYLPLYSNYIVFLCLLVDSILLFHQEQKSKHAYLLKKNQFLKEWIFLSDESKEDQDFDDIHINREFLVREAYLDPLKIQLDLLESKWERSKGKFFIRKIALLMFLSSITAVIFFSISVVSVISLFVTLASMSLSRAAELFADFTEKNFLLAKVLDEDPKRDLLIQEQSTALHLFIFSLIKSTVLPCFLLTVYSINVPATVALIFVYFLYELYCFLNKKELPAFTQQEVFENEEDAPISMPLNL